MDPERSSAFVDAICTVFETMFNLSVQPGETSEDELLNMGYDVSSIVGMSGGCEGSVALRFPVETAQNIVALFVGSRVESSDALFKDAIGELANIVASGIKSPYEASRVFITCPSVVIGSEHTVFVARDMKRVTIPFICDCGEFAVQVAIRDPQAESTQMTASSVSVR